MSFLERLFNLFKKSSNKKTVVENTTEKISTETTDEELEGIDEYTLENLSNGKGEE